MIVIRSAELSFCRARFSVDEMMSNKLEQSPSLIGGEVAVESDGKDSLPLPVGGLDPLPGVDDNPLKRRAAEEFLDEVVGLEKF
jgi:hypothetical protein